VRAGAGAGFGGAIFNMQGDVTIRNSTLTGNSATGGPDDADSDGEGLGGALFNLSGTFAADGSTFAANAAPEGGASIYNLVYDGVSARTGQTTLRDTIVWDDPGSVGLVSAKPASTSGPVNLGSASADLSDFNLLRSGSEVGTGSISGSPLTSDPQLGALADNGGPTRTMAPATGSPVVDAGSSFGLTVDQRGLPRRSDFLSLVNAGDGSDVGAVELQSSDRPPPAPGSPGGRTPGPRGGNGLDTTPPALTSASLTNKTFAVNTRRAAEVPVAARAKRGTVFRHTLSEDARVLVTLQRARAGRRVGRSCRKRARSNRKRRRCTRFVRAGRFAKQSTAGANRHPFSGRIGRRSLRPGKYRATLVATDAAGNRSASRRLKFKVVKR
jgi:hypothetical protein